jgi:hypothetical protein
MAVELKAWASFEQLAKDLAYGRTQVILPCGGGETTEVWAGNDELRGESFTSELAGTMLMEAIDETIDGLEQDDWTHLGETPEQRIAKLERARTWLSGQLG